MCIRMGGNLTKLIPSTSLDETLANRTTTTSTTTTTIPSSSRLPASERREGRSPGKVPSMTEVVQNYTGERLHKSSLTHQDLLDRGKGVTAKELKDSPSTNQQSFNMSEEHYPRGTVCSSSRKEKTTVNIVSAPKVFSSKARPPTLGYSSNRKSPLTCHTLSQPTLSHSYPRTSSEFLVNTTNNSHIPVKAKECHDLELPHLGTNRQSIDGKGTQRDGTKGKECATWGVDTFGSRQKSVQFEVHRPVNELPDRRGTPTITYGHRMDVDGLYRLLMEKDCQLHEKDGVIYNLKRLLAQRTELLHSLLGKTKPENALSTGILPESQGEPVSCRPSPSRHAKLQSIHKVQTCPQVELEPAPRTESDPGNLPYYAVRTRQREMTTERHHRRLPAPNIREKDERSWFDYGNIDKFITSGSEKEVKRRTKRYAISGESSKYLLPVTTVHPQMPKFAKSEGTKNIITHAILENDFMKHLDSWQIEEIIDSMCPLRCSRSSWIIQEGEIGSVVYVLEDGLVDVLKRGEYIRQMGPGSVFGELAILYNCTRTASVKAVTHCKLWAIDRHCFQSIMVYTGIRRQADYVRFLKSVPTFSDLSLEVLSKVADVLGACHYQPGEYVIREGARGNTFFIIADGQVKVTKNHGKDGEEQFIRYMQRGDWFGEKALTDEDVRTANIMATAPTGVDCLLLDRDSYNLLIKDLVSFDRTYPDEKPEERKRDIQFCDAQLTDFEVVATIGVGGFGRVQLVKLKTEELRSFALKKVKKKFIADASQQEHVLNEKEVLMEADHDFIVKLYRTFKDQSYLYFLLEACLGGEVWTVLRKTMVFDNATTRFYTACVVEAVSYLHRKGIVYRDLKPENLLLDDIGYCKMTDFGFAKKIGYGNKTWTFCGTPEYLAPEVILNKGHDFTVDIWSLGILMFELLTGTPPFNSSDAMRTYNLILKGTNAVEFPKSIDRNAQCLIKKLCRENPSERLGARKDGISEVRKHVWFEGFNWNGLLSKTLKAPIISKINSKIDVSNFDIYEDEDDLPPEDFTNWDKEF